ncbi:erythromycin esterase family protein [Catenulispora subtropica]|uniref:Erythromycin esterase family protein n=1 Tax=Catenulispora subtropica TaxID=450798 RepID=A0ABP5BWY1_9ACTN
MNTPRILALGEPTHGEDTLLAVRNDLFRQQVEEAGYRTIALESDCLMGLIADEYVRSGAGDLDEVMERGFSHDFGRSAGNRELVRWMRSHNEGRPEPEQVRFAGFDGPLEMAGAASPRESLTALHAFLAAHADADLLPWDGETLDQLIGDDARWTEPAAMMDPSRSVGRTADAQRLRLIADDLAALLAMQAPQLISTSSADEWERAQLHARTATGLLRYHSWMADTSPGRMAQLLGTRASMMAANLLALADRGPVLAYAHNAHFQRPKSSIRMGGLPAEWWSAGAMVSARLGADYGVLAMALGTIRHRGVETPDPDTVEGVLYALPEDRRLIDVRQLGDLLGGEVRAARVSPWFGYAPLDPRHLGDIDGLVFVKDCFEH